MSLLLETRLRDIHGAELRALIGELEQVCGLRAEDALVVTLLNFLSLCLYPGGHGTKRAPIDPSLALQTPLLETQIRHLPEGDLRSLCGELARLTPKQGIEFYLGSKVYVLIEKAIPKQHVSTPSEGQARRQAVALQRRANRR